MANFNETEINELISQIEVDIVAQVENQIEYKDDPLQYFEDLKDEYESLTTIDIKDPHDEAVRRIAEKKLEQIKKQLLEHFNNKNWQEHVARNRDHFMAGASEARQNPDKYSTQIVQFLDELSKENIMRLRTKLWEKYTQTEHKFSDPLQREAQNYALLEDIKKIDQKLIELEQQEVLSKTEQLSQSKKPSKSVKFEEKTTTKKFPKVSNPNEVKHSEIEVGTAKFFSEQEIKQEAERNIDRYGKEATEFKYDELYSTREELNDFYNTLKFAYDNIDSDPEFNTPLEKAARRYALGQSLTMFEKELTELEEVDSYIEPPNRDDTKSPALENPENNFPESFGR